jgi:hypothetical protein
MRRREECCPTRGRAMPPKLVVSGPIRQRLVDIIANNSTASPILLDDRRHPAAMQLCNKMDGTTAGAGAIFWFAWWKSGLSVRFLCRCRT